MKSRKKESKKGRKHVRERIKRKEGIVGETV